MSLKIIQYLPLCWLLCACGKEGTVAPEVPKPTLPLERQYGDIISTFELLPEKKISYGSDSSVAAFYTKPLTRYAHGILGDKIEGGQLVMIRDSIVFRATLPNNLVFEDIAPRLVDVDQDGELEAVAIRTHLSKGAGIAIYKIRNNALTEYATVAEIGSSFRWLNIAALDDLDDDGVVEIAWVQTPHIGGILKVAKIKEGKLTVLSSYRGVSNHAIGSRNLALSFVRKENDHKVLYLPAQSRDKVFGFDFHEGKWKKVDGIIMDVDFSKNLREQVGF